MNYGEGFVEFLHIGIMVWRAVVRLCTQNRFDGGANKVDFPDRIQEGGGGG